MSKKLSVIVCGWHYSYKFYEDLISQKIPNDWEVDFFVISHRDPENKNTIEEKQEVRNYSGDVGDNLFLYLDKVKDLDGDVNIHISTNDGSAASVLTILFLHLKILFRLFALRPIIQ